MRRVELLYWDGCPSHPRALADLRAALVELGHGELEPQLVEMSSDEQAHAEAFIGSPTIRVDGADLFPPASSEAPALTCRVYWLRDGRPSPTPDPADLRDALRTRLDPSPEEVRR